MRFAEIFKTELFSKYRQKAGCYINEIYDIMPFTFADVLILRYLMGIVDAEQTVEDFELVNNQSQLNWSFRSQISKFIKRFFKEPYREEERQWIKDLATKYNISIKQKLAELSSKLT